MANVIKTVLTYPLDGSTRDFNIPFEYLARKFVVVTLIGVDRKVLTINTDYRFATRTTISLTKAWGPSDGYTTIELRRVTSTTDRLVDFTDGSILRAYDLNVAQIQTMHVAEEARDLTADTIGVNNDGHLDARGRRIVNLANAIDDRDAVPFGQLKTMNQNSWQARNDALRFRNEAETFRNQAEGFKNESSTNATNTKQWRDDAKWFRDEAEQFKNTAGQYADAAGIYAGNAKDSEDEARRIAESIKATSGLGYTRKPIASAISSVLDMLDAQPVNVWEFVGDITVKPDPSDPSTWDWTPAFERAIAYISHSSLSPDVSGGCIFVPAVNKDMIYHITSVTVPVDCALVAYGATISPYDYSATETHLFKFMGVNKVAGLQIAMDYSLTYASAIWCRGRNIDFSECAVWFAANAITVGDPAWLSDPSQGYLGDSEISFSNCQFNWCLKTCTAYGINTIVAFVGGSRCYTNRGSIPSSHPNAAAWASAPMGNFINYGAHIYIVGCFLSTFSRDIPTLTARVMPTNTTDYQNTYGRFIVEGTHIETSFLYYAPPESPAAADVITKSLVVHNCQGHIATSPANNYWVVASDQMLQGIIISECGFYGTHGITPTRTKLITAPSAPVFVGRESFNNVISGDFKDACNINYPMKTNGLTLVNASGSVQSIGTSGSTLIMPWNGSTSLINGSRGYYYSNSTGTFTAAVTLSNVSIIVDLRYSSPSSLNTVTLDLVVSGTVVDSVVVTGGYPRGVLFAPTISKGANFTVRATGVGTYTLSGSKDCKIRLIANT